MERYHHMINVANRIIICFITGWSI